MIRIHFTAADFARVRFAPRPAPLQELNAAFMTAFRRDDQLLFGRWRQRLLRSLPDSAGPLGDLVPAGAAPGFLDVFSDSLEDALDSVLAARPELVRSEIERVYAGHASPAPPWIRALHRGDAGARQLIRRAQHTAFETVLRPVWPLVQDLHRAEFTRHALTVAEHGTGAALTGLLPGTRLRGDVWEIEAPGEREVRLRGRGLLLLPTFHWNGRPMLADLPGGPLGLTYPAGPGLPLAPDGAGTAGGTGRADDALAGVLGRTRTDILIALAREHTTSGLARRVGVSNATASAHAAALRDAGLITTVRDGRAVLHRRTALGTLLAGRFSA
ncbi:winged helix-turn-helix domain-containing protein [Streptomyces telluris]|uniref:Winged helix-turn-helix domain-containing protein n=1 Tax=Streptomyces telluris TaxID=2720021 RepID=A0A9X2RLT1_9ACTN|nr:winged helix-turn-helix domain-containing protein [Streptomyces telluris]MCQ8768375.1 winged helix-turn-helix domain-containing protein [Streptomyces telluris]NJP77360.1 winged helix-turn-helix transcriptional regulator [Streptomyces telluris]